MQGFWIKKEDRSSCILFLSGWGMDPSPFISIPVHNHDLFMIYDYTKVDIPHIEEITKMYSSTHLVAWSMGVWIAGKYFTSLKDRFTSATAVNGTLMPIDDNYGIPAKAFDVMINEFSPDVLEQFYCDMFDQPDEIDRFLGSKPTRSLESIANELKFLQHNYAEQGPGDDIFTRKIVGTRDRIFMARSQQKSWGKENCVRVKAGHFPFYDWPSWDQIVDGGSQGLCE